MNKKFNFSIRYTLQRPNISTIMSTIAPVGPVQVKQETADNMEESRVPPLPTNDDYFDMKYVDSSGANYDDTKQPTNRNTFFGPNSNSSCNRQDYGSDASSPLESKPFAFFGFDERQLEQHDVYRYVRQETVAQYKQYDTGDTVSQVMVSTSTKNVGMKRAFNNVERSPNAINKRRLFDGQNTFTSGPMQQSCITELSDPSLGKPQLPK